MPCSPLVSAALGLVLLGQQLRLASAPLTCTSTLHGLTFNLLKKRLAHARLGVVSGFVHLGLDLTTLRVLREVGVAPASFALALGHFAGSNRAHTAAGHHTSLPRVLPR